MVNVESLIAEYRRRFNGEAPTVLVRAPGRVNLIGEHVDYCGGLVLPVAIDLATCAVAGPRTDERLVAHSVQAGETIDFDGRALGEPVMGWSAYVQGVFAEFRSKWPRLLGGNLVIDGDLPLGAGLSSSAALEAAVALCLIRLNAHDLTREGIAECCREAEHQYAGVPCGIMDQLVVLCAREKHAMLIDCRDETFTHIPWTDGDATIVIVDSRSARRLAQSLYAQRVDECNRARMFFPRFEFEYAPTHFRAFSLAKLERIAADMQPTLFRRARHVLSEIARVEQAAEALRCADLKRLGDLMNGSHRSLALDYEVSSPQMDDLAAIVRGIPGVFGARMTGAGFGGCVVAVAERGALSAIESAIRTRYDVKYGVQARVWTTMPCDGATVKTLE